MCCILAAQMSQSAEIAGLSARGAGDACASTAVVVVVLVVQGLTEEAVDNAKQATHGADDRRDDLILPLDLQAADVNISPAGPRPIQTGRPPGGVCHPGVEEGRGRGGGVSGGGVRFEAADDGLI